MMHSVKMINADADALSEIPARTAIIPPTVSLEYSDLRKAQEEDPDMNGTVRSKT